MECRWLQPVQSIQLVQFIQPPKTEKITQYYTFF